jgi:regulatory protein
MDELASNNYQKNTKNYSIAEAKSKIKAYCDYQERCHQEVRTKLLSFGIRGMDLEELIIELIEKNYLNEQRFAKAFVRGKFNYKKWGIQKIQMHLKMKNISPHCIKIALKEIDRDVYLQTLDQLIEKKTQQMGKNQQKMMRYLVPKGYSFQDISDRLKIVWKP